MRLYPFKDSYDNAVIRFPSILRQNGFKKNIEDRSFRGMSEFCNLSMCGDIEENNKSFKRISVGAEYSVEEFAYLGRDFNEFSYFTQVEQVYYDYM